MVAEGTTLSMALSRKQIADLREQPHILGRRGRLGLGVVLAPRQQQVHRLFDEEEKEEDDRRRGEEHDQRVDQVAVGKARAVEREAQVRERVRPEDRPHERGDDVLDDRGDDGRERRPGGHRDGQFNDVPAQHELAQFLPQLSTLAHVTLHCLVEIPKGSRNKYEYDEALGGIKLDRFLFSSVVYPADYGFIPRTLTDGGDHLDALILVGEPTFPGCVIEVRAIAVLRMASDGVRDDKIVCVPCEDPHCSHLEALGDIPGQLRNEIEHFFSIYKQPEGKEVEIEGYADR